MTTSPTPPPHAPSPPAGAPDESPMAAVLRMLGGFAMTQVVHTAVRVGIPDRLGEGSRAAAELATELGLHADALERFLRMMAVLGLVYQVDERRFRLSEAGQLLRSAHPQSLSERALYVGTVNYPTAAAAPHALRTGEPAFDHVFGEPFFDYLAHEPTMARAFQGLMQRAAEQRIAGILDAYDFSGARHIVDLGGGNGTLLAAILERAPHARGTVVDMAPVVAQSRERLRGSPVAERIEAVEGDLMAGGFPAGADIYILSNIIHDWHDGVAERILRHCAAAMAPTSTLILVEELMPARVLDSPSTVANDYSMLLLTGGRERSEAEYRQLARRSGLRVSEVIPFAAHNGMRKGNWALVCCHHDESHPT
jgi:SAM-dependent methyltransferase